MNRDQSTYGKISQQYDQWADMQASKPKPQVERGLPPQRPYTPEPEGKDMGRTVFAAIGVGIGLFLLAMAAWAFITAAQWGDLHRDGAATGYTVVGFFLTAAGIGGILATLNHNFRVLARPGGAQGPTHH